MYVIHTLPLIIMKKLNRLILIILFLGLYSTSSAKYYRDDLYSMIIKAEEIVYGTIVEIDSKTFTLSIDSSLTSNREIIKIERFENWACAQRWTKYEVGQKVLLFLSKRKRKWYSMSAGNEGELPIVENSVFLNGFSVPIPPPPNLFIEIEIDDENLGFNLEHHNIYGGRFFGTKFKLNKFIEDISFIRENFDFEYGRDRKRINWKVKCDLEKIKQMANDSDIITCVYLLTRMK